MLDLLWQRLFPGHKMTRIHEPDLLIDHDSGGGCRHFLSRGPVLEPFAYSGVGNQKKLISSGGSMGKWFAFPSITSSIQPPVGTKVDGAPFNSCSLTSSSSSSVSSLPSLPEENPVVMVVHNNNNNIILDMSDENTRWPPSSTSQQPHHTMSSSTNCESSHAVIPPVVIPPGLIGKSTKLNHNSNFSNNNNNKHNNKSTKHGKNINSSNKNVNSSNKNNGTSNNNSSTNSINNNHSKDGASSRINNCAPSSVSVTVSAAHIDSSSRSSHDRHNQGGSGSDDEDSGARHLIIRYIHCNERPNKKQLVTLGLISVVFIIILIILLALFLTPAKALSGPSDINYNGNNTSEISDAFISSDTTGSLNNDYGDADDSESYDDGDASYYSSTSSSSSSSSSVANTNPGLDLKKVSKLSWDLLNSNQDASSRSRGSSGSSSKGTSGSVPSPLGSSGNGEGEIILPAKMIYTSSGDSTDLMPSENGTGSQNKKRSCCRTQKYSQVIKREGCEPLTIVNKMCFGQCVSVWVPGLFASFPVCRPSKSTFKTVTLTCGRNREKRKRVRIEKVRRCSCMEIEPTAASL